MDSPDRLAMVRTAIERGEWTDAVGLLAECGDAARTSDGLELAAAAAYGAGNFEHCVEQWEELYALLVEEGEVTGAARAAAMIAMYIMMDTGMMSPVRGWLRRAERLLDGKPELPTHALIAMVKVYERLLSGDVIGAGEQSARAIELGERHGVEPAVVIGRVGAARVRILDGDVREGLDLLDEVGALLMTGEVDALTTGMMYCELICVAQGLALHDRAAEWTEVMEHWRHGAAFGGINGRCRVHRAEMFRFSGPCDRAEQEALAACEELRPWMRREYGWPLVELGNIRYRMGDLDGAEEAYRSAHEHAWSPQPGLALVYLERGDAATAAEMIADAIAHPFDIPSKERPPFGDLRLAPLLDAQVEIASVTGDAAAATSAADALHAIAASYPSRSLRACAVLARGRVALLDGHLDEAIESCGDAVGMWTELGGPFEAAVARTVLADALQRAGSDDAARREWQAASTSFGRFGAARRAASAAALASPARPSASIEAESGLPYAHRTAASFAEPGSDVRLASFRRSGDIRTIEFQGVSVVVRDLKGYRYVERLLAERGREFHVLDLVGWERGAAEMMTGPGAVVRGDRSELAHEGARGQPGLRVLDDQARRAYQRRLAEVEADIEEANDLNDPARAELAQRDRDYLIMELERALGLGGRDRTTGDTAERARTSVTRSIRYALGRLNERHAAAASHLERSLRTGTYCSYSPESSAPTEWRT